VIVRIAFCLALFAAAGSAHLRAADIPAAPNPIPPDDRHVLIITMDGFPSYVFRDPHAPIPTIRRLAAEGVAAEGMRVSNPAVTWPNHTTLVTGVTPAKHGVLFNGLLMRDSSGKPFRVDPARDQREMIAVPTLWDTAHAAGLTTAAINWPASRNSPTLDCAFPDCPNQFEHISSTFRGELIEAGIVPASKAQFGYLSPPQQEQMWTLVHGAEGRVVARREPDDVDEVVVRRVPALMARDAARDAAQELAPHRLDVRVASPPRSGEGRGAGLRGHGAVYISRSRRRGRRGLAGDAGECPRVGSDPVRGLTPRSAFLCAPSASSAWRSPRIRPSAGGRARERHARS